MGNARGSDCSRTHSHDQHICKTEDKTQHCYEHSPEVLLADIHGAQIMLALT